MIIDGALLFSNGQDLTVAAAGTLTPSTNIIDLSTPRDLGTSEMLMLWGVLTTLPTSATAGATITMSLQGSPDAVNFTTIEDSGAIPIAGMTLQSNYLFRGRLPIFGNISYRYLRVGYTVSAVLTAGQVEAGINLDVPRHPYYPRNYTA